MINLRYAQDFFNMPKGTHRAILNVMLETYYENQRNNAKAKDQTKGPETTDYKESQSLLPEAD
jgi:hypothetical protein